MTPVGRTSMVPPSATAWVGCGGELRHPGAGATHVGRWRCERDDDPGPAPMTRDDAETGEPMPDVIAICVPGPDDKEAVLQSGPPWFTTRHFDGYNYVLVRERDLGQIDVVELAELLTDAWASRAPRRLVKELLG